MTHPTPQETAMSVPANSANGFILMPGTSPDTSLGIRALAPCLKKRDVYWYVGTPYSKYADGIHMAAACAAAITGALLKAEVAAFSPIAHSHLVGMEAGLDALDHTIWMPLDEHFMANAHGLIVVMMEGWQESKGLALEVDAFRGTRKPVVYLDPYIGGALPRPGAPRAA